MLFVGIGGIYDITNEQQLGVMSSIEVTAGTETLEIPLGDQFTNKTVTISQALTGTLGFRSMRSAVAATLLGGTVTTGAHTAVSSREQHTISTATITLSNTPITDGVVQVIDEDGVIYVQESSVDETGEYSISGTTVTFDSSLNGKVVYVTYLYADSSSGASMTVNTATAPSSFNCYAWLDGVDEARSPDNIGKVAFHLSNVKRSGDLTLGATRGEAGDFQFSFEATGLTMHFPGDRNQY